MALSRLSSVLAMCGTPLLIALEQMAIWLHELQTGVEYVRLLLQFRTDGRPAREDYCAQWCGRAKMGLKLTDASFHETFRLSSASLVMARGSPAIGKVNYHEIMLCCQLPTGKRWGQCYLPQFLRCLAYMLPCDFPAVCWVLVSFL